MAGPSCLKSRADWYTLTATMPQGTAKEQFQAMLRNLLTERFGIQSHHEMRTPRSWATRGYGQYAAFLGYTVSEFAACRLQFFVRRPGGPPVHIADIFKAIETQPGLRLVRTRDLPLDTLVI